MFPTHHQDGHEGSLQQAHEHVAPVVLVVGHPGQPRVDGRRDQEELQGGPQEPGPASLEPRLEVKLHERERERERERDDRCAIMLLAS